MSIRRVSDKQAVTQWDEMIRNIIRETPVPIETDLEKKKRIEFLKHSPEDFFKYYFPNFYRCDPAPFHVKATKRVINNPEWYEVRCWSRETAKSTRAMMEDIMFMLTGHKRFKLLISSSYDNAERLLTPYKLILEKNARIIADYGMQEYPGNWDAGDFTTQMGFGFRALGAGQSPRGAKNEEIRPDIIDFDDFDTDEECLNIDIIDKKWRWANDAAIGTRSIDKPTLIRWNGNIIAEDCCIVRAMEYADKCEVINIRDGHGKSTWPAKNTDAHINRVLSKVPYATQQKEYYNNPIRDGKIFKEMIWDKCPSLKSVESICIYADPATSNKDKPMGRSMSQNSCKAVFLVAKKDLKYYVYTGYLDTVNNSTFIDWLYEIQKEVPGNVTAFTSIENNSLQDPFYEQVLYPLIVDKGRSLGSVLSVIEDTRKKPEKFFRIAALEGINKMGHLVLNIEQKNNPHMKRLETQFKSFSPSSKTMDGPDAIEGAKWFIDNKLALITPIKVIKYKRAKNKY